MFLELLKIRKNDKHHWEKVYTRKTPGEVTWYQVRPVNSLELLEHTGAGPEASIIDIGSGASNLVDHLVDRGFGDITVLDISDAALRAAQRRMGERAEQVIWIEADIIHYAFTRQYDIWHDRAVFHFLTEDDDREAYLEGLNRALKPGGYAIFSTFGPEGPRRCSGLPVKRYSPDTLHEELGEGFELLESRYEVHHAPTGHRQQFIFCLFRKRH